MPQMSQTPFDKPMTFLNALEHFTLALTCVMVALRDEAAFHDGGDERVSRAAHLFSSSLEDAYAEAILLAEKVEERVGGGF
ncbi:MAG: hypothetical protein ACKOBC_00780 [Hyphomicrobiales bacterium]